MGSFRNFDEFFGNIIEMSGYNMALFSEKSNGVEYDITFNAGKLDSFCKIFIRLLNSNI